VTELAELIRSATERLSAVGVPSARHDAEAAAERRSLVKAVDRSQRVRTYNFPENRISDHGVGYKAYNLDHVIDGDLDAVISALMEADRSGRAAAADGG
jgi:peptide chain release factor 1